jgi:hypothetical protein
MTELPDYNKITFPEMPPIPLEKLVPDATSEVSPAIFYTQPKLRTVFQYFCCLYITGCRAVKEIFGLSFQIKNSCSRSKEKSCSFGMKVNETFHLLKLFNKFEISF